MCKLGSNASLQWDQLETLAVIPCLKVEVFMSQGYNNTQLVAMEVSKLCIDACDTFEDNRAVSPRSLNALCHRFTLWVVCIGAESKFEASLGYFLGPRQLQPFLLGVGCQVDFKL